jgi:hypothetical protein
MDIVYLNYKVYFTTFKERIQPPILGIVIFLGYEQMRLLGSGVRKGQSGMKEPPKSQQV